MKMPAEGVLDHAGKIRHRLVAVKGKKPLPTVFALRHTLDPNFVLRELPATPVKGVSEPLCIFAVDGFRTAH